MSITEPSVVNVTNSIASCDTYLNPKNDRHTWTIDDFSHRVFPSDGSHLEFPKFTMLHNGITVNWYLGLASSQGNDKICLTLYGELSKECEIFVRAELFLINENREESINLVAYIKGVYHSKEIFSLEYPNSSIPSRQDIINTNSGFCPENKFTIVCKITIEIVEQSVTINERDFNQAVPQCQLIDDIGAMFENKDFCDVKLTVGRKDFHAHKNVLVARSSVFAAMFKHEMIGEITNTVHIIDIDYQVFEEVLRFLYTGKISSLTIEMATDLLIAAAKYNLNRLKIICEVFIGEKLTTNNAIAILILADMHNSTLLKKTALEFISAHMNEVMKTSEYESMVESRPDLNGECCIALTERLEEMKIKKGFSQ